MKGEKQNLNLINRSPLKRIGRTARQYDIVILELSLIFTYFVRYRMTAHFTFCLPYC